MDVAAAFDILSIQLVKSQKSPTEQNVSNYFACLEEIKEQIGGSRFFVILNSQEFQDLKAANLLMFNTVEDAKEDKVKASTVDKMNYERFLAKGRLQKKFFSEELTEQKIGY